MATFNQVTFIGRAGKMPELKVTKEGTPYLRFSLARNRGLRAGMACRSDRDLPALSP